MQKVAIIGAGDVVIKRTKPAFEYFGYEVTLYSNVIEKNVNFIDDKDNWIETLKDMDIIWIATPSFAHINYLKKLIKLNKFIVVEKPITCIKEEIDEVRKIIESYDRNKLFFTSYYTIEKALSLNYFKNPINEYLEYLDFYENGIKKETLNIDNIKESLGNLNEIYVKIIEGNDERIWPYLNKNGTHLIETFLHNMLMANLFTSLPFNWKNVNLIKDEYKVIENEKSPTSIKLLAEDKNIKINLEMKKNQNRELIARYVSLKFKNGNIFLNLETQNLEINKNNDLKYKINLKEKYKNIKYATQVNLAIKCFNNEFKSRKVDGLTNQLEIIEYLLSLI